MCTTSGQAANLLAMLNIMKAGDHFISTGAIYGGTVNLFAVSLQKLGIECTFVNQNDSEEEIQKAFKPNTKAVFGETIANPALTVLDIEKMAKIAHKNGVPFIVDNTFATPILCRPFEFGADIVTHSTTKYMDGHAIIGGGVIVDSGNFNWNNGKFPEITQPDESYHGIIYTEKYGKAAYITKARMQLMRDFGCFPTAQDAFLLNLGLETLPLRIRKHCENALAVAKYLEASDKIESVNYPGLESSPDYKLIQKYCPEGASGVVSVCVKGGKEKAAAFLDGLKLTKNCVHVADARCCVMHPASGTHRQLTDEQLVAAGVKPNLVRFSVGIENIEDILEDIEGSLKNL